VQVTCDQTTSSIFFVDLQHLKQPPGDKDEENDIGCDVIDNVDVIEEESPDDALNGDGVGIGNASTLTDTANTDNNTDGPSKIQWKKAEEAWSVAVQMSSLLMKQMDATITVTPATPEMTRANVICDRFQTHEDLTRIV
jgi:hypothetical protein